MVIWKGNENEESLVYKMCQKWTIAFYVFDLIDYKRLLIYL